MKSAIVLFMFLLLLCIGKTHEEALKKPDAPQTLMMKPNNATHASPQTQTLMMKKPNARTPPRPPSWVGFRLSLFWPPGYCHVTGNCIMNKVKESFTIHGLWPDDKNGFSPPIPTSGSKYNDLLMYAALKNQLRKNWPNYKRYETDKGFWRHEWEAHGVISESLFKQVQYFQKSLSMHRTYNITNILARNQIFPGGNSQNPSSFVTEIEKTLKVDVLLICTEYPKSSGQWYLTEIRICFDQAAARLVNCNHHGLGLCETDFIFKNA